MNVEIKGVHYDISDNTKERFQKKITRLSFAEEVLIDLLFSVRREKQGYVLDCQINFRWGTNAHLKVENHDLYKAIDSLFDKLETKITREKEKVQEH